MKVLCVLSEFSANTATGGAVASAERAKLLCELADTTLVYLDWRGEGPVPLVVGGQPASGCDCLPLNKPPLTKVGRWAWRHLSSLWRRKPWFYSDFLESHVHRQMKAYIETHKPDVVCFDNIPSTVAWRACEGLPRVYFAHNVEAEVVKFVSGQGGRRASPEQVMMAAYERRIVSEADAVFCFTEKDAESLRQVQPRQRYVVVPPAFSSPLGDAIAPTGRDQYVIMPTNATWMPNVLSLKWFFSEVFPLVPTDIQFVLTGRDDKDFLKGLAAQHPNVRYDGLLPLDQYQTRLQHAGLFVNPTRHGSGFQIKLMEAVRYGVPSVSTAYSNHLGPLISSTDDPAEMAAMIAKWMKEGQGISVFDYAALHDAVKEDTLEALAAACSSSHS